MPDHEAQFGNLRLGRRFPSLRIFECAQIALSPASVMIATLAVVLLDVLTGVINESFKFSDAVLLTALDLAVWPVAVEPFTGIGSLYETMTRPWQSVIRPLALMLIPTPELASRLNGFCQFLVGLGLWSFAGLILCRRSAMLFAGNDESTFGRAIQYSLRRWTAASGAPLIPMAAAALLGFTITFIGLFGQLPLVGGAWLFMISPILVVLGFAIAFLLLATALGWPFMVAAVSTDDCDSFGGLSRAYSGLTGRPWQIALHVTLGGIVGLILMQVVTFFGEFTIWCAMVCTVAGSGQETADQSLRGPLALMILEIVKGIGVSYFWSAAVVIYLLLRHDVDGVPVDRVAPDDDSRAVRDPFPVVGIPAMDAANAANGKPASES